MAAHEESLNTDNRYHELCERFESRWKAGETPRIEDVLKKVPGVDRATLLGELLLVELNARRERGESPVTTEYESRFPNDVPLIADVFDSLATRILLVESEGIGTVTGSRDSEEDTRIPGGPEVTKTFIPGEATRRPTSVSGNSRFGDYELLHEIARGGMGIVYKARQTKLNRIVALKMIKSGGLAGEDEVKRFHSEAEAAAQLDHPNIVPIYEVGVQDGQHFFSMGFIEGRGLDARLKDGPLPSHEAASLTATIAEAVQFAHDKGIVHRDLKPISDRDHPGPQ